MVIKTERIEARFLPDVKLLAERAAVATGVSLTDYLAKLVREDAPKALKEHTEIQLTNQQFDHFIEICEAECEPSQVIRNAARRLDEEGF